MSVALSHQSLPIRTKIVLLLVFLLLLLNYGFMQVRIAFIPLGEIVLVLFLLSANLPVVLRRFSTTINPVPFFAWWLFGIGSAAWYLNLNGIWALRDANNVLESLYILVGFSIFGSFTTRKYIINKYPILILITCAYGFSYPFSQFLREMSPDIIAGAGHAVPLLFYYTNSSTMLLVGALYLSVNRGRANIFHTYADIIVAFILLFTVGFFQARTIYLQIIALLVILLFVRPASGLRWLYVVASAFVLLFLLVFMGVEIEGRLGQVFNAQFLYNHFMAIFGIESSGVVSAAGGVELRLGWWWDIYYRWSNDLMTMLFGLGFGFPLVDFGIANGVRVREPHNSYISVLARSGIFGFSLWLWLHWYLINAWRISYKKCKQVNWHHGEVLLVVMLGYFVMIGVVAIGEDGFEKPFFAIPYYFLWGVVLRIYWFSKRDMITNNGIKTS